MAKERKDIIVKSKLQFNCYGRFKDFVEIINVNFKKIPEEYRSNACLDIMCIDDYDGHDIVMEISYQRPETDEEFEKRIGDEKTSRKIMEEQERRLYLKLKKKFEKE